MHIYVVNLHNPYVPETRVMTVVTHPNAQNMDQVMKDVIQDAHSSDFDLQWELS